MVDYAHRAVCSRVQAVCSIRNQPCLFPRLWESGGESGYEEYWKRLRMLACYHHTLIHRHYFVLTKQIKMCECCHHFTMLCSQQFKARGLVVGTQLGQCPDGNRVAGAATWGNVRMQTPFLFAVVFWSASYSYGIESMSVHPSACLISATCNFVYIKFIKVDVNWILTASFDRMGPM